jgi:hypothetical protein
MIQSLRTKFNEEFTKKKYQKLLDFFLAKYNYAPTFRICETPVFFTPQFKNHVEEAIEKIIDVIVQPNFLEISAAAIPDEFNVPNENAHPDFLVIDFGVCEDNGELVPKLIELQGFPSLYFFQLNLVQAYQSVFNLPNKSALFNFPSSETYLQHLHKLIVADAREDETIMLEIEPEKQNTYIDFLATQHYIGTPIVCVTKLFEEGDALFYRDDTHKKIQVKRIYNRVIFDELAKRSDLKLQFDFKKPYDVHWVGHPNWFFRISKYTMPFLKNRFVPKTFFLNTVDVTTLNLENYVLKPLFSFSGQGVKIDVTPSDIAAIHDPENFILQEKVTYAEVLQTPSGTAKVELRMLLTWERDAARPKLVNNLVRVSKGKMIGVRYNKDKDWVGGSIGLF